MSGCLRPCPAADRPPTAALGAGRRSEFPDAPLRPFEGSGFLGQAIEVAILGRHDHVVIAAILVQLVRGPCGVFGGRADGETLGPVAADGEIAVAVDGRAEW